MSSWESGFARWLAVLYGEEIAPLDRPARVSWLQQRLAALEAEEEKEYRAHESTCEDCRAGRVCIELCLLTPAQVTRSQQMSRLRAALATEAKDEEYAARARAHGVIYEHHIDGFCSYWQNIRHRLFVVARYRCQRCGMLKPLEAHHLHYDTLGFEELSDLQALCRSCHDTADQQRGAQARFEAGLQTYARKKYGDAADDIPDEELEEEFEHWLEDRDDG